MAQQKKASDKDKSPQKKALKQIDSIRAQLTPKLAQEIYRYQKAEITEYHIYTRLARRFSGRNQEILQEIAQNEKNHAQFWAEVTQKKLKVHRFQVFLYTWIARIFGLTFAVKLMERGEQQAQSKYAEVARIIPYAQQIKDDEEEHEHKLLDLLQEERLRYASSVVLGLNDALVELTGALAGLTFALQETALMSLAGLITGISASLSMAASEYLSSREEADVGKSAIKSSVYTGTAYIFTVLLLVLPYLVLEDVYISLGAMLTIALIIIFVFNYYISVAKDLDFRRRFSEMAILSMGVALLSFGIGWLLRQFIGV